MLRLIALNITKSSSLKETFIANFWLYFECGENEDFGKNLFVIHE